MSDKFENTGENSRSRSARCMHYVGKTLSVAVKVLAVALIAFLVIRMFTSKPPASMKKLIYVEPGCDFTMRYGKPTTGASRFQFEGKGAAETLRLFSCFRSLAASLRENLPAHSAGRGPERKTAQTVRAVYGGRRTIFLQRNGHPLFLRPPIRQAPRNSRSLRGRLSAPEESHSTNGANSISSGSAASAAFRTSYRKPAR